MAWQDYGRNWYRKINCECRFSVPLWLYLSNHAFQFINHASGGSLVVGSTLASCTKEVSDLAPVLELRDGRKVQLIDTPGFSDTSRSDAEILETIADYLVNL